MPFTISSPFRIAKGAPNGSPSSEHRPKATCSTGRVSLSNRPKSWLGIAWNSILTSLGREHSARLAKGRGLARAGRVRDLWFSPGIVHAEVHDDQNYQVSLRVAVLEEEAWSTIVALLGKHLHLVASLLEGILSSRFLKMLEAHDLGSCPSPVKYMATATALIITHSARTWQLYTWFSPTH